MKGQVIKSTGLWYEVKVENEVKIARLRGKLKLTTLKLTNPIAVGDWVELVPHNRDTQELVIERVHPRENYVIRQSPRKKGHDHMIASNIDQGVLVVTQRMPRTSVGFIDRFLISLEAFRIPGVIIFNKSDLYLKKDEDSYQELKDIYESIGYQVLLTSLIEDPTDSLISLFLGKCSLLSGHSGAGKSTLINHLIPEANQEVKDVSSFASKGVHTTTFAEMFSLDKDSSIIDTLGF